MLLYVDFCEIAIIYNYYYVRMLNDPLHANLFLQRNYTDLIKKVLGIFKPKKFIVSLLANEVSERLFNVRT